MPKPQLQKLNPPSSDISPVSQLYSNPHWHSLVEQPPMAIHVPCFHCFFRSVLPFNSLIAGHNAASLRRWCIQKDPQIALSWLQIFVLARECRYCSDQKLLMDCSLWSKKTLPFVSFVRLLCLGWKCEPAGFSIVI
jgi:hypothetical protein